MIADATIRIALEGTTVVSEGKKVTRSIKEIREENEKLGRSTDVATRGLSSLRRALVGLLSVGAVVAVLYSAAAAALEFGRNIAEVSTLLSGMDDMPRITAEAKAMAVEFGSLPTLQAKGFYQAISAGASDAAAAVKVMTMANKLAVGGVTDVKTAVDGLTTVLNAYGPKVRGAASVSDAMFVAMRAGKTTIAELSASIGTVAPLAAQAGVSFDQLMAATSALTKGGVTTNVVMTGLRAILAAVVKPSGEAAEMAKALGIEFNVAAIQGKGFAGFMEDVVAKTRGSSEAMATLFGGVEAVVPALALAGQAGKDFASILDQMQTKAGETERAFEKMANSPAFKLDQLKALKQTLLIELGDAVVQSAIPSAQNLKEAFDDPELRQSVRSLGTALGTALREAGEAAAFLVRNLEAVRDILLIILSIQAASYFAGLANGMKTLVIAGTNIGGVIQAMNAGFGKLVLLDLAGRFNAWGAAALGLPALIMGIGLAIDRMVTMGKRKMDELMASMTRLNVYRDVTAEAMEITRMAADARAKGLNVSDVQVSGDTVANIRESWSEVSAELARVRRERDKLAAEIENANPLQYWHKAAGKGRLLRLEEDIKAASALEERLAKALGVAVLMKQTFSSSQAEDSPNPPGLPDADKLKALRDFYAELEEMAIRRQQAQRLAAAELESPESARELARAFEEHNAVRARELELKAAGVKMSAEMRSAYLEEFRAERDAKEMRDRIIDQRERATETLTQYSALLARLSQMETTASGTTEEWAQAGADLGFGIERLKTLLTEIAPQLAAQLGLEKLLVEMNEKLAGAQGRVTVALNGYSAALDQQNRTLRNTVSEIDQRTAAVLAGAKAEAALNRELEIRAAIWDARPTAVAGESPQEFAARWRAAADEIRSAMERAFAAQDLAAIRDYVSEPFRQAAEQVQSFAVEAMDAWRTEGFDAVEDVAMRFLDTWIRALEEWLVRWIATMAKARMAQAALSASGGDSVAGNSGGGYWSSIAMTGSRWMSGASSATAAGGSSAYVMGGTSTTAGAAFGYLFLAAVALAIVYKGFIEKSTQWAEHSTRGASAGNSAKVASTVRNRVNQLIQEVQEIAKALDIPYERIGDVTLGKRGKTYYVKDAISGSIGRAFDSAEAAMEYARVRALQLAEYGDDVSQMVQAAIRGSRAMDTNQLRADIERARELENIGKPQTSIDIDAAMQQYRDRVAWIIDIYRTDLTAMAQALAQAGLGLTMSMQAIKDQISGRQKTPKEEEAERARMAAMFNASLAMLKAELQAKKIEIDARAASIRAIIAHGGALVGHAGVTVGVADVMLKASAGSLSILQAQLAALEAQSAAIDEMLRNLPGGFDLNDYDGDGIPNKEDKSPWGRQSGSGAGRSRKEERERLAEDLDRREASRRGDVAASLYDINARYEEEARLAKGNAELLARVNAQRQYEIDLLKKQTVKDARAFMNRGTARGGDLMTGLAGITDEAADLVQGLVALGEAGELAKWRVKALTKAIQEAAENQRQQMGMQAYRGILLDVYSLLGREEEMAQLRFELTVAELEIRYEELRIAAEIYNLQGINFDVLRGLIADVRAAGPDLFRNNRKEGELPHHYRDAGQAVASLANAAKRAAETFKGFVKDLVDSNREVLTNESTSSLGTGQRFAFALSEYERNREAARNGDPEAWRNLVELRSTLLEVGQQWFADGNGDFRFSAGYRDLLAMTVKDFAQLAIDPRAEKLTMDALVREQLDDGRAFRKETDQNLKQLREAVVWGALQVAGNVGNVYAGPGLNVTGNGVRPVAPVLTGLSDPATTQALQGIAVEQKAQSEIHKKVLAALQLLSQGRTADAQQALTLLGDMSQDLEDTRNALVRGAA